MEEVDRMSKLRILYYLLKSRYFQRFNSRQHLQQYQAKKLSKHYRYLKQHSPYYQDHAIESENFMDKQFMMDHFDLLNTVGIKKEQAFEIALKSESSRDFSPMIGDISVGLSSGTSGHRGIFLTSPLERDKWAGTILGKLLPQGKLLNHRIAFFMRANNQLYNTIQSKFIDFKFYDMYRPLDELISELIHQQPTIVVAPASVLLHIAMQLEDQVDSIRPIKVISVAEVLEERDAQFIQKVLKQDHIHQIYQCTEGFLGSSCEHGTIHLNEVIVHIELYWLDDSRFHPIITDFNRQSQPIIRDLLNDILVKKSEPCPCGSTFMAIEAIEGRSDDIFEFASLLDEQTTVAVYPDFIRRCMLYIDDIINYRVIQKTDQSIEIQYEGNPDHQALIINQFEQLAEQLNFQLTDIHFAPYNQPKETKQKRVIKEPLP